MPKAVSAHSTRRRVLATAAALVLAAPPPIAAAFTRDPRTRLDNAVAELEAAFREAYGHSRDFHVRAVTPPAGGDDIALVMFAGYPRASR